MPHKPADMPGQSTFKNSQRGLGRVICRCQGPGLTVAPSLLARADETIERRASSNLKPIISIKPAPALDRTWRLLASCAASHVPVSAVNPIHRPPQPLGGWVLAHAQCQDAINISVDQVTYRLRKSSRSTGMVRQSIALFCPTM